jgi:hypothetical protein
MLQKNHTLPRLVAFGWFDRHADAIGHVLLVVGLVLAGLAGMMFGAIW